MRPQHQAYIGLGSNLEDPLQQVRKAISALAEHTNIQLLTQSRWYRSKAVGPGEQDDYINGVALVGTSLPALELLDVLQGIEQQQGRERSVRWGARTLDLDLLLYNNKEIDQPRLQVPHPRLCERNFVVQPLLDISPDLALPDGRQLTKILHIIGIDDLHPLST